MPGAEVAPEQARRYAAVIHRLGQGALGDRSRFQPDAEQQHHAGQRGPGQVAASAAPEQIQGQPGCQQGLARQRPDPVVDVEESPQTRRQHVGVGHV